MSDNRFRPRGKAAGRPRPAGTPKSKPSQGTQGTPSDRTPKTSKDKPTPPNGGRKPTTARSVEPPAQDVWEQARLDHKRRQQDRAAKQVRQVPGAIHGNASRNMSEDELAAEAARLRAAASRRRDGNASGSPRGSGSKPRGRRPAQTPTGRTASKQRERSPQPIRQPSGRPAGKQSKQTARKPRGNHTTATREDSRWSFLDGWLRPRQPLGQIDPWLRAAWVILWITLAAMVIGGIATAIYVGTHDEAAPTQTVAEPTTEVPYKVYRCEPTALRAVIEPARQNANFGQSLSFKITLQNTSEVACTLEATAKDMGVIVTSGDTTVFNSTICTGEDDKQPRSILLDAGGKYTRTIQWDGHKYNTKCEPGDFASPGGYHAKVQLSHVPTSAAESFLIK